MSTQARVNPAGMIVDWDRTVHATKDDGSGVADGRKAEHTCEYDVVDAATNQVTDSRDVIID